MKNNGPSEPPPLLSGSTRSWDTSQRYPLPAYPELHLQQFDSHFPLREHRLSLAHGVLQVPAACVVTGTVVGSVVASTVVADLGCHKSVSK